MSGKKVLTLSIHTNVKISINEDNDFASHLKNLGIFAYCNAMLILTS